MLQQFAIPELRELTLRMPNAEIRDELQFTPIAPQRAPLLCVDSGSAELIVSPSCAIQVIRIAAVHWHEQCQRFREEWLLVLVKTPEGYRAELTPRSSTAHAFPQRTLAFSESEQVLLDGGFRGSISRLGGLVRKLGELQYAKHCAQQFPVILVLDGNLQANSAMVEEALLQLVDAHPVVGFAKTADLFTAEGFNATAAVAEMAAQRGIGGCWYTNALATMRTARNIAFCFAKLHVRAQYVFRIDALQHDSRIMAALAAASSDPVFFGYPYPLIAADQLARIGNEEREQLTMELIARSGEGYTMLRQAMHAIDAHSVLDRIR